MLNFKKMFSMSICKVHDFSWLVCPIFAWSFCTVLCNSKDTRYHNVTSTYIYMSADTSFALGFIIDKYFSQHSLPSRQPVLIIPIIQILKCMFMYMKLSS